MEPAENRKREALEVLRASPVFALMGEAALEDLCQQLEFRAVAGGTLVLREGDEADSMIIVIAGRLRVWRWGEDGQRVLYNEILPGETVGETGMILHQKRTGHVTALRDSVLAVLTHAAFEALLTRHPLALNRAFSQAIYHHLRHSGLLTDRPRAECFAVVPLSGGPVAHRVATGLLNACAAGGRADHVHIESEHGKALATDAVEEVARHLDALEGRFDFLVLEGEASGSNWTRSVARQADQVIFAADAGASPSLTVVEKILAEEPGFAMKRKHLVLLYPQDTLRPEGLARWRGSREVERIYPVRAGHVGDFARLMRFLTGAAVGLVLGGGGARGFAHLGVLRALEECAIPIDLVGGNSMGALVGALYALGVPLEDIERGIANLARAGEVPTLPMVSLLSGRRMERGLRRLFGEASIEQLWRPFFAAACDLSRATTAVQDRGPLWRAVLASNSPAGLLPPVVVEGNLLVDGAILDNVPVSDMRVRLGTPNERRRGNGSIIAVDVDVAEEFRVDPALHRLPLWRTLKSRLRRGEDQLPDISDILYRASHIGGLHQRARTAGLADFYLAPPVAGYPLMGYAQAAQIVEAGYRHALEKIPSWRLENRGRA